MAGASALQPYVWMVLSTFFFACMGALTHDVDGVLDWQVAAMVRSAIPFALALALARAAGARLVVARPKVLWLRSVAGSISLVATFCALSRLPPADVFTVTNAFPIWVALLSWPVNGSIPGAPVWVAALSACAGVCVINQWNPAQDNGAIWLAVGASLSTAVAMMGLNRLRDIDSRAIVAHFSAVSFCFAVAAYFFFDHAPTARRLEIPLVAELAGIGITATIGQILLTKAFTHGDAAKISVLGPMQVVWTLLLEVSVLGHELHLYHLVGIPLVLAPTAWLIWREGRGVMKPAEEDGDEAPAPAPKATPKPAPESCGDSA
ncbi:MAG: DMT family transporter [Gemmataceae bacterium]